MGCINKNSESLKTIDDLKSNALYRCSPLSIDPNQDAIDIFIDEEKQEIIQFLEDNQELWEEIYNNTQTQEHFGYLENLPHRLEYKGFQVKIYFFYPGTGPHFTIEIVSNEFHEARQKEVGELNSKIEQHGDGPAYQLKKITSALKIKPERSFEVVNQEFSTEGITDALNKTIDPKISGLVELLNSIGLETSMSCQGHPERKSLPSITFENPNNEILRKVLSVFTAWELQGGKMNQVELLGEYYDAISITYPEHLPLEEAQKDLADFTVFLKKQIQEGPNFSQYIRELIFRGKREIKDVLKKSPKEFPSIEELKETAKF